MKKWLLFLFVSVTCLQSLKAQNNALHFESNDYVQLNAIAQDVDNLSAFTVEFWVKFDAQENADYNVFYGVNTSNYGNRFLLRCAGPIDGVPDAAVIYINDGSDQYIIGNTPIGDNKCHHIAFTYDNGVCALYVDGQLDASGNYTFTFHSSDLHSLGQEFDMTTNPTSAFYTGELDDFRIWGSAKSQVEINSSKDLELQGNETGLLTYFDFNQGIQSGNNTAISTLNNLTEPSHSGAFIGFNLNGTSTSNFVRATCSNTHVGISENEGLSYVEIYPNPVSSGESVVLNSNIDGVGEIRNIEGKLVQSFQVNQGENLIETSSLNSDIYFVLFGGHVHKMLIK